MKKSYSSRLTVPYHLYLMFAMLIGSLAIIPVYQHYYNPGMSLRSIADPALPLQEVHLEASR